MKRTAPATPRLLRRLAWMFALWLGGVATVGAVALLIRFWLGA